MMVSAEELKRNADEGLNRVMENALKQAPDVQFESESRMGDVVDQINEVCEGRDVVALVTGTKDLSGFERFLLGNTTLSIVKNSGYPVLAVPEGAATKVPMKIALAVDFLNNDEIPVEKITALVQQLGAELHIIHVEEDGQQHSVDALPAGLQTANYHSLKEDDVAEGIQHFVTKENIDLVVVLPHKHSLYERLFSKGHTQDIIQATPVPVLCIK
jgi:nucleotide-binding universal stress UspA family protein